MGTTAGYYAMTPLDLARARIDVDFAWSLISAAPLRPSAAAFHVDLGKSWRAVQDLLSPNGKATTRLDVEPVSIVDRAILGGASLRRECDMGYGPWPRALEPAEVGDISVALSDLDPQTLRARFDPEGRYSESVERESGLRNREEMFEFLLTHYQLLRDFYRQAAHKGYAVIVLLG